MSRDKPVAHVNMVRERFVSELEVPIPVAAGASDLVTDVNLPDPFEDFVAHRLAGE